MLRKTVKELGFHSLIYMIGSIASILSSIILLPVYTRFLTPTDYGMLEIIDNLRNQLIVIILAGLVPAMAKFYKETDEVAEQRSTMSTAYLYASGFGGLWVGGLLFMSIPLAQFLLGEQGSSLYVNLGAWLLFFQAQLAVGNSYLNIQKKSQFAVVATLFRLGLNVTLNLYFIIYLRLGARGMLWGEFISSAVIAAFLSGYLLYQNGIHFNLRLLGRMLRFGLPFIPNVFAAALMHGADRSLLRPWWPSVAALGIYGLGYKFPFMLNTLLHGSFGQIWGASVMYDVAKQPDAPRTYARITTYFMTLYIVCQYALSILAPTVVRVLAAPEYFQAWHIIQIVSLGMCGYTIHQFFSIGAYTMGKTWYLPIAYTVAAIANIGLNWYFLPRYGAIAAAWNTTITYLLFSAIGFYIFRKIYPIPFEFRRIACLSGTGIVLVLMNNAFTIPNCVLECLKEGVFVVIFPLILLLSSYLKPDEKKVFQETLNKIHPKLAFYIIGFRQ